MFEKSRTPVAQRAAHPADHPAGNLSDRRQAVTIRSVTTRKNRALFIKLPRVLYQGAASYTPPLDIEQRDLLDPGKAPIFRHASVQYFLAWRGARPVGRIAAIVDYVATAHWEERIGLFGALDAEADESVIRALLDAARAWLRENGMVQMRGPVTLNCHGESGVMVTGQDEAPHDPHAMAPASPASHDGADRAEEGNGPPDIPPRPEAGLRFFFPVSAGVCTGDGSI
ncbi:MAG: hypothetical protein AAYR33_03265 [Acetobacteraceae bacterium]